MFRVAGAFTMLAMGQRVGQEVFVAEEVVFLRPQAGALIRVHIALSLNGKPEISVVFKTGFVFILIYMAYHEGVVLEKRKVIPWVVMKVGLSENRPCSRPSVERVDLGFTGSVVRSFHVISTFLHKKMGAVLAVRYVDGLVFGEEIRKINELAVFNFL